MRQHRALAGAACGLMLWLSCFFGLNYLPAPIAFYVTAFSFIFGWGALLLIPFEEELAAPERSALALAFGTAVSPLLIWLAEVAHLGGLFPAVAYAATGTAVARWYVNPRAPARTPPDADGRWYLVLGALAFAVTAWVSAGRITVAGDRISVYGDYDTFDLTYYAVIASELGHTIPPSSPFYAGHQVVYSYFPILLITAVHKFSGVALTRACLELAWPFFSGVAAATLFAFCRRLGSVPWAALSTLLVFGGSGLAYITAWFWPETARFDRLVLSSMFMAPSAEWLFFNTWTPALTVLFAGLYALDRANGRGAGRWLLLAGPCFGLLFMFKSFAFGVLIPALVMTAAVYALKRDRSARRVLAAAGLALLCAAPWLYSVLSLNRTEGRADISIQWLSLPRRMLFKMDLSERLGSFMSQLVVNDPNARAMLTVAIVIFLIGGIGARCAGLIPLWRAATGHQSMRSWTPLAWIVIVGVSIPFAIAVAPFPNSIQAYQLALFVMWPFAVRAIWPPQAVGSPARWIAVAAFVLLSVGATTHYALAAHRASTGPPLASLDDDDFGIVKQLRMADPTTTMVLHSGPLNPSLYAIESGRRVVLAWSAYAAGDGSVDVDVRTADIERFFGTTTGAGVDDLEILYRYQVTHVIERVALDHLHPHVVEQLRLVTGTPAVRLYEVPEKLRR